MFSKRKWLIIVSAILVVGLAIPQELSMPVQNANHSDYHAKSFWFHPWGKSGTHKGVDIFAVKGTRITAATKGIVLFAGNNAIGGNFVLVLGPKWRLHYYAHLDRISTSTASFVDRHVELGTVGATGNALGKPAHLHYSIITLIPYFWKIDTDIQGWKKMFYLNPIDYLQ